jgi:hypothetical protein
MYQNFFIEEANKMLPWFAETKTSPPPIYIVRLEFSLKGLHYNTIHVTGFCGKDRGIVKLYVMSQVNTALSYGWLAGMFQLDVPLVLL